VPNASERHECAGTNRGRPKNISRRYISYMPAYTKGFVLKVNLAVSQEYGEKIFPTGRRTRDCENAASFSRRTCRVACCVLASSRRSRSNSVKHPPRSMS